MSASVLQDEINRRMFVARKYLEKSRARGPIFFPEIGGRKILGPRRAGLQLQNGELVRAHERDAFGKSTAFMTEGRQ